MIEVKITGDLFAQWFEEGNEIGRLEVKEGLPEGCQLVDAQVKGVVFEEAVLHLYFDDGNPGRTEQDITLKKHYD